MHLRNAEGKAVVRLEADERRSGLMMLADPQGEPRLYTGVTEQGGVAHMRNRVGETILSCGAAGEEQAGALRLFNASGGQVFHAAADGDGAGRLDVADGGGETVLTVGSLGDAGVALELLGADGRKGVVLAARPDGGLLNVRNELGNPTFIVGHGRNSSSGLLSLLNRRGIPVVQLTTDRLGAGMVEVKDEDGDRRNVLEPPARR
jgi:hypothetical protein